MVRLALLFLIGLGIFVSLRLLLARRSLSVRQFGLIYVATLGGLLLLFLGVTGRLHWLFAALGVVLPFVLRLIPLVLQLLNLSRAMNWFQRVTQGNAPTPGQKSQLKTDHLAMELDHDSGAMDGEVLTGRFKGKKLSAMALSDILALLDEVAGDGDSVNVLRAYLDRVHPDWNQHQQHGSAPLSEGNLSVEDSYDILGLEPGADREAVRAAHRRLIKVHHPDHGGSTYLAARINEAKSVLLQHLEG